MRRPAPGPTTRRSGARNRAKAASPVALRWRATHGAHPRAFLLEVLRAAFQVVQHRLGLLAVVGRLRLGLLLLLVLLLVLRLLILFLVVFGLVLLLVVRLLVVRLGLVVLLLVVLR